MSGLFSKKPNNQLLVDMHSHFIPGIDDGARDLENSVSMAKEMVNLGFQKLITTPHIHPKYPNEERRILASSLDLKDHLESHNVNIEIDVAAEYYVDENFLVKLNDGTELLTFGDNYLLVECSFISKPLYFESVVYQIKEHGYQPVFAHPERYIFLEDDPTWLKELKSTGLLFQVTLGSIGGGYGKTARKLGLDLIKNKMVDFLASDLHNLSQVAPLQKGLADRDVQNLLGSGKLLNQTL
ncbi:MAG: CpsB/CapC family capsule biosynthesis tyrosine phosphatase [Bacteroidota bacterium]